jgi:hypothetical protein
MNKYFMLLIIVVLTIILIMGCEAKIENSTSTPEYFITPTFLASETFTPQENTSTPTLEIRPTPTALPTLSPKNARQEVLRLLQDDTECKFPCFWGFVPGATSISDTMNILNVFTTLGDLSDYSDNNMARIHIRVPVDNDEKLLGITFNLAGNDNTLQWLVASVAIEKNQPATNPLFDKVLFEEIASRLSLPQVLSTYGRPSDVKIFTYSAVPQGTDEFKLLLLYPEYGFMVEYSAPTGIYIQSGRPNQMIGCFADAYVYFLFWKPSKEITTDDVILQTSGLYIHSYMFDKYRSIGDVTDLSLETFYTKFATADGRQCLMTPEDFWSVP